jgi:hypothetical protein
VSYEQADDHQLAMRFNIQAARQDEHGNLVPWRWSLQMSGDKIRADK